MVYIPLGSGEPGTSGHYDSVVSDEPSGDMGPEERREPEQELWANFNVVTLVPLVLDPSFIPCALVEALMVNNRLLEWFCQTSHSNTMDNKERLL